MEAVVPDKGGVMVKTLKQIWRLNGDLEIKSLGENIFIFDFSLVRYKKRALEGYPWIRISLLSKNMINLLDNLNWILNS